LPTLGLLALLVPSATGLTRLLAPCRLPSLVAAGLLPWLGWSRAVPALTLLRLVLLRLLLRSQPGRALALSSLAFPGLGWGGSPSACRFAPGGLGDFAVDLIGEVLELALGSPQGRRIVAQDALGCALDTLPHFPDPRGGVPGRLGSLLGNPCVDQLFGGLERIGDLLLGCLAGRVVEPLGQKRFGFLGFLHRAFHPVQEPIELLALVLESLAGRFAFAGAAERMLGVLVPGVELFGEAPLVLVQASRLVAHLGHRFGEAVRRLLAKLFADVVQLPAGAGALGQGLGETAVLESLRSLPNVLPALLDLVASLGHSVPILLALHPFPEFVSVTEDLLLLFSQPLELPLDFLSCLGCFGGLEGRLELLEPLVQVGLALSQLAEPAEDLPQLGLFPLLLRLPLLLRPGCSLLLVSILIGR
jgi:hypothetical protein